MIRIKKPYIIAEMACSHDGSLIFAKEIIDGAGKSGADAIQFQIWEIEDMMVKHSPDFQTVSKLQLSYSDWKDLYNYTRSSWPNLEIIACIYDTNSLSFAQSLGVDAFKIHTSDLSNPNILKAVALTGKRIDLSVGASSINEIYEAINLIKNISNSEIWLMYGYQLFPTPLDELNLSYMLKLGNLFSLSIGYQDHCDAEKPEAFWLPASVYGMGVEILEKHITHDRNFKGADHQSALNPDEFFEFVKMIKAINCAEGKGVPRPFSEDEKKYRKYSKKSIVASKNLKVGKEITEEDIIALRGPKLGLSPDKINQIIGKKLNKDILEQHLIHARDVS